MMHSGDRSDCPGLDTLHAAATIDTVDVRLADHLKGCESCRERLSGIRRENELLAEFVSANADTLLGGGRGFPEIAGYELLEEIHRGGQGIVYRAVQTATKRQVAVKTLLQGTFATSKQRARFEREVELAAGLRHPNIVTLHDSGRAANGSYFLAMEYLQGRPLDADTAARGGPPGTASTLRAALDMFARVCGAVQAAHQRGVIHRDLKPANILVDEAGEPHVLDFGLARLETSEGDPCATVAGEFLGTYAYASPEQLVGDPEAIDVRADVYALGVVLFEMLTGERPYRLEGSVAEVIETIVNTPPRRPSSVNARLNDEIDTIVLTALSRDPERRYQSAGALLEDIRRYLAGAPIAAKRDSGWYVLRKTLARHRVGVAVASAFVALAIGFGITMAVLAHQATTARQRAVLEAEKATGTLMSLLGVLRSDALTRRVGQDTLPAFFAEADRIVGERLDDQPAIAAPVRRELGLAKLRRDDYAFALDQFRKVLALQQRLHEGAHPDVADSLHNCGRALWYLDRHVEAEEMYTRALNMFLAVHGPRHETVARTTSHLGATYRLQGRYAEAGERYHAALEMRRALYGDSHPLVAASLNNLGVWLRDQRRFDEAAARIGEALTMIREFVDADDDRVAQTLHNLALCSIGRGALDDAEMQLDLALRIKRSLYEQTDSKVALSRYAQAWLRFEQGRIEQAESACREALAAQEARLDPGHTQIADSLHLLGTLCMRTGRAADAEPLLARGLEIRQRKLPSSHWEIGATMSLLGASLAEQGRFDEAEPMLVDGHRTLEAMLGPDDAETRAAAGRLAAAHR